MAQSLEELRRENEQVPEQSAPEPEEEKLEEAEGAPESEESEEGGETPTEAWMGSDEEPSQDRKFTDRDIGAAKAKLRAKLEKQHNAELEALRQQVQQLQGAVAPTKLPARPREEDFDYDPDKYAKALNEWDDRRIRMVAAEQAEEMRRKQLLEQQQQQLQQAEDQHYDRAAKLISEHGIKPELYKEADARVKSAVDRAFPGKSDLVTAQLVSVIGEGSEKVIYYLGRNAEALSQFEAELVRDPTGIRAVAFLSRKAAEITMPKKPTSKAPAPATQVRGDVATVSAKDLKRKYQEAHKRDDLQTAIDAKRKARAAGIDTTNW